jgi:hypothetical protein
MGFDPRKTARFKPPVYMKKDVRQNPRLQETVEKKSHLPY